MKITSLLNVLPHFNKQQNSTKKNLYIASNAIHSTHKGKSQQELTKVMKNMNK